MSHATVNIPVLFTNDDVFEPGDCRAVHLGEVKLGDGRVIMGVLLEFPCGAPSIPFSAIWEGTPLTLAVKQPKST